MIATITNVLQKECKIQANDLLVVGVSGGPDSLCLLHILHALGYPIISVHVNHGLRPEAGDEAQVVEKFSTRLGVEFFCYQVDVQKFARENSISIEEAARTLRYRSLFEQATLLHANAVVVGHNADDQVETILMHLLRGSGLAGLRGMDFRTLPNPWSDEISLLRPLLSTSRVDIQNYLDENKLEPVTDRSNLEIAYFRNRVRRELISSLESYNPNIREVLLRMGQNLRDDYLILQQIAGKAWESTIIQHGDGYVSFDTTKFINYPVSIQRYLLRMAIAYHLPGLRDVGFDCIERGLALLPGGKSSAQTDLIAGFRLIKDGKRFWVIDRSTDLPGDTFPRIPPDENMMISIPSTLMLNDGWQLHVEEIYDPESEKSQYQSNPDPYQAWMDISKLDQPLIIRARNPGDQIKPFGLQNHSIKISDLMINLKLPGWARSTWPLVASVEAVLWVPGYCLSEDVRIHQNSRRIVHFTLFRGNTA